MHYLLAIAVAVSICAALGAAEILLPQNRNAFYSDEPIEVAVAGLAKDEIAEIEFAPAAGAAVAAKFKVTGDGSTAVAILPPRALAPGIYAIKINNGESAKIAVARGVRQSTFFISQTGAGWSNFVVSNAFSFGLLDQDGQPLAEVRGKRSGTFNTYEKYVADDTPSLIYMYWTGYITHKPWGTEKSWANADMMAMMRLFNFHIGQRLRRYGRNFLMVGTMDEPGLSWGKTPAGGMASGFPNWDEEPYYAAKGWTYTQDIGSQSDADFLKYMAIRCGIIGENNAQAKRDLKAVWPGMVFSTDLYALHAIMDGTDTMNQLVNDIPSSHVFVDWGIGRIGAYSAVCLEKAACPLAKLAHAMNGQLFASHVPQPQQRQAYHATLNAMFAAGLYSNWWLNMTAMSAADLTAVNQPAARLGPLFQACDLAGHEVAVLWSFTELAMRQKEIAKKEAAKKGGEQIKLMIASLPEDAGIKDGQLEVNAYSVGQNYKDCLLHAHYALARAGYPAHFLDERILEKQLAPQNYRVLVIIGQTFALPESARAAIAKFQAEGGEVVVDKATTVKFENAVVAEADLADIGYRWSALFHRAHDKNSGWSKKKSSFYLTNFSMDEPARAAVAPLKAALAKTKARPVASSESADLLFEKHGAGQAALYLVLNAHEELPERSDDQEYWLYNHAPLKAKFTLAGIQPGSVAYVVEGLDWSKCTKIANFSGNDSAAEFAPGEMKLYLVLPPHIAQAANSLRLEAALQDHGIHAKAVAGAAFAMPLTVSLRGPDGKILCEVFRATNAEGIYEESFPLGANAAAGEYIIAIFSPLTGLRAEARVKQEGAAIAPQILAAAARVFDENAIRDFLRQKPRIVIARTDANRDAAEKIARALADGGCKTEVKDERAVISKAKYPRIWNPYLRLYKIGGENKAAPGEIKTKVALSTDAEGAVTAVDEQGKSLTDWRQPGALVTVAGEGWLDWWSSDREIAYEAGVQFYVDAQRQLQVLNGRMEEVKTTPEIRARWAKPWSRLTSYVGAFQLPPQLPEAYVCEDHLIVLGDSATSQIARILQASELPLQTADAKYPGPGKALVSFIWSPFAVEKNVILIAASDAAGLEAGGAAVTAAMK